MSVFPARGLSGGALLRPKLTASMRRAALIELARFGYARMSMGSVARRAGVGKAALYRRWSSKEDLITDLLRSIGIELVTVDDTGALASDLREYVDASVRLLSRPLSRRILPDLYAEMSRDTALSDAIRTAVTGPKRRRAADIIDRAIARGEVPRSIDKELALDALAGPLYWRLLVTRETLPGAYVEILANMLEGALRNCRRNDD